MNDFTFRFSNMPQNYFFLGNDALLRVKLWNQVNQVIADQMNYEVSQGFEDIDIDSGGPQGDFIADITFAKTDSGETKILHELLNLTKQRNILNKRIKN